VWRSPRQNGSGKSRNLLAQRVIRWDRAHQHWAAIASLLSGKSERVCKPAGGSWAVTWQAMARRARSSSQGRSYARPGASNAEVKYEKDLLRAEFAMSTRRLEMTVECLMDKISGQLVELNKKDDMVNRLKVERDALEIEIITLPKSTRLSDRSNFARLGRSLVGRDQTCLAITRGGRHVRLIGQRFSGGPKTIPGRGRPRPARAAPAFPARGLASHGCVIHVPVEPKGACHAHWEGPVGRIPRSGCAKLCNARARGASSWALAYVRSVSRHGLGSAVVR
jgi:hypothetical protein